MQQAKLKEGVAFVQLDNGDRLSCIQYEGTFTLTHTTFFAYRAYRATLCDDASLSNINKKAEKYGIEFVL